MIVVSKEGGEVVLIDKAENAFDREVSSDACDMFKSLLGCDDATRAWSCFILVELLQLGKIEKGALTIASK